MTDGGTDTRVAGPVFDYASFGRWYDTHRVDVLEPALSEAEATLTGLLRDNLSDRDLARIRGPVGRVKSKARLWRKLCRPRYAERIASVDEIPDVIDDLIGARLTCTNRRDIDVVREVFDALATTDRGQPGLWLEPATERDYLSEPRPSGYRGWHVNLGFGADADGSRRLVTCELQVRTLLQDGWGELTHEDTYKKDGELPPLVSVLSRRMADLLATLDDIAEDLRNELDRIDEEAVTGVPDARHPGLLVAGGRFEQADDAAAYVNTRWRELDRPIGLGALAWELQREYGAEITDAWFGHGAFKRFLIAALPNGEITTGRHAYLLPAAVDTADTAVDDSGAAVDDGTGTASGNDATSDVPRVARELHRIDRTFPLLAHDDWTRLFDHLAEAWRRTGSQAPDDSLASRLIQSTCDRSTASGPALAQRHVEAVVRDLVAESDGGSRPADELAGDYATLIQHRLVELRLMGAHNRNARGAVRRWIALRDSEGQETPVHDRSAPT